MALPSGSPSPGFYREISTKSEQKFPPGPSQAFFGGSGVGANILDMTPYSSILRETNKEYLNMAKAHVKTASGTTITIEGTPDEVAKLVQQLNDKPASSHERKTARQSRKEGDKQKATPNNLVSSLIDGGFFKKPKDLAAIKVALEEMGHYYPVTSLSPTLLRLVRKRQLRRMKEKKRWLYTG